MATKEVQIDNCQRHEFMYLLNILKKNREKIKKLKRSNEDMQSKLNSCICSDFNAHDFANDTFVCKKVKKIL